MAVVVLHKCPPSIPIFTFNEAAKLLSKLIDHCEELRSHQEWKLFPLLQKRSRTESRFKLCHSDNNGIKVLLRPGQNDSAWEYRVVPPDDVGRIVALRVFGLWDGWTGHGQPRSYQATLEDMQEDAKEEEQSFHEESANPVVSPATKPASMPLAPPVSDGALAVLQGLADTLASAARLKAEIYKLQNAATDHEELALKHMAAAEVESKKAADIGKEIAAMTARLNNPKIMAAQAAIAGLQALMNEGK